MLDYPNDTKTAMSKKFADTPSKRFLKLGAMGAKVATTYTRGRVKQAFQKESKASQAELYSKIGEQVVATLGELKGAAMKVGQVVSQFQQFFPEEFTAQLAKLQQQSSAMDYALIEQQIRQELGFLPEQLFAEFSPEPFAAASIGQVHKAVTHDGREVVLKVQYPGVAKSCRSDLAHLKRIFWLSGILQVEKSVMDDLFVEIETNLLSELDYQQEAANLKEFRQLHQQRPWLVVPEVLEEYSSERVLCLSYEPGDKLTELREKAYSQEQINTLAERLISAILTEMLQHLRVHCDPHPGNFAFRQDGTVIIYDYGAVADIQDELIDQYIELAETALRQDFDEIDDLLLAMGVRNPAVASVDSAIYQQWYQEYILPVLEEQNPQDMIKRIQPAIKNNVKQMFELRGAFQPKAAAVFLNRVIGGHFLNLAQMGCDSDIKTLVLNHIFEE